MTAVLPANLNEDTLPVFLEKQLGIRLVGDALLNIMAGMPVAASHQVLLSSVTTAASAVSLSAGDTTRVTTELTRRKAGK